MNKAKQNLATLLLPLEKLPEGLMRRIPILVFTLAIFFVQCKKEKVKIKTPEDYRVTFGDQTFGVYLNGQPWIPDYSDPGFGIGPISVDLYGSGFLRVIADKNNEKISLFIPAQLTVGRVMLNSNTLPYPDNIRTVGYGMYQIYSPSKKYITTNNITGFVDLTTVSIIPGGKIEGSFEFEAVNSITGEKVKVTNGYFKKGFNK